MKMDEWLLHTDVMERVENYYSKPDIIMPVYSKIDSIIQKEFYILVPVRSRVIKSCLKNPEFAEEMKIPEFPLTHDTPRGREFSRRIRNRFSVFPDVVAGLFRYYRKSTQEDVAIKRYEFSEGRKVLELNLNKKIILEDLRKVKRKGLFCFEVFRFSERTLEELGCQEKDEIEKGDYYIFHTFFRNNTALRFRMNSVFVTMGKAIIEGN